MNTIEEMHELNVVSIRLVKGNSLYSDEPITTPDIAVEVAGKELSAFDREVLAVLNLNTKHQVINMNIVSMGGLSESICRPRDLFKSSILSNAAAIILMHNHPSGDVTPSQTDIETTKRVCKAGKLLGIPLLDHIVVGRDNMDTLVSTSFKKVGIIFDDDRVKLSNDALRVGEEKFMTKEEMIKKRIEAIDKEQYDFRVSRYYNHEESQYGHIIETSLVTGIEDAKRQIKRYQYGAARQNVITASFHGSGELEGFIGHVSFYAYEDIKDLSIDDFWINSDPNYRGDKDLHFYGPISDYKEKLIKELSPSIQNEKAIKKNKDLGEEL